MVQFSSRPERCRRQSIAEHFGLEAPLGECGACDVCCDAAAWRSAELSPRPAGHAPDAAPAGFARGQWVRFERGRLGRIVRVEGEGRRTRLFVECADNLEIRALDPRRVRAVDP